MVRFVCEEEDGVEGIDVAWIEGWMGVKRGRVEWRLTKPAKKPMLSLFSNNKTEYSQMA